ncbi:MAG: methyltransferase domain-containing protein [Pseudomonadota bacterium]
MSLDTYYKDHWVTIESERLERYEEMFVWSPAQDALIEPADIHAGQTVADFGCGPGYLTIELLNRVGETGIVHAFDVNEEFLRRTGARAAEHGLEGRLVLHHLTDRAIPIDDAVLDRIIAKNVMVYVDDPGDTFREFRRVLRADGCAHAIDSDFLMAVVDPIPAAEWRAFIDAAAHAFRTPSIGRQLYRLAREAGFADVQVNVLARPDTRGRLLNFVRNVAGYARLGHQLDDATIQRVLDTAEQAVNDGVFMALNPQFLVTAR